MFISKISIVPAGCIIISVIIALSLLQEKDGDSETAYTPESLKKLNRKQMLIHNRAVAFMLIVSAVVNIIPVLFFNDIVKVIFSLVILALGFFAGAVLSRFNRNNYVE